jgi:glutathione peroxidase
MSIRQTILRKAYPLLMKISAKANKAQLIVRPENALLNTIPSDLTLTLNNGEVWHHGNAGGKFTLLVNTASDCGFTPQYEQLQALFTSYADKLTIIAIPSNDFKQQEPGKDSEIAQFCVRNYGVSFPIAQKAVVSPNASQHPVYRWLSQSSANGWNDRAPDWNFSKYLLAPNGSLMAYMGPAVEPSVCAKLLG